MQLDRKYVMKICYLHLHLYQSENGVVVHKTSLKWHDKYSDRLEYHRQNQNPTNSLELTMYFRYSTQIKTK